MPSSSPKVRTQDLIVVPAVITLAVTLLRLAGEIHRWDPRLFNRTGGGGGAIVGIVWLVPVFGIWFAVRLARAGAGPSSRGGAVLWPIVGAATFAVIATAVAKSGVGFMVFGPVVN